MVDNRATIGTFAIIQIGNQIVLVHHAYGVQGTSLPGGGIEAGETPDIAVRREVCEETGLDIPLTHTGTYFLRKSPGCVYLFVGEAPELPERPCITLEIQRVILCAPDALPNNIYPAQRKLIERWRRGETGDIAPGKFFLI